MFVVVAVLHKWTSTVLCLTESVAHSHFLSANGNSSFVLINSYKTREISMIFFSQTFLSFLGVRVCVLSLCGVVRPGNVCVSCELQSNLYSYYVLCV